MSQYDRVFGGWLDNISQPRRSAMRSESVATNPITDAPKSRTMTLKEIAERIAAHLARFEADKNGINKRRRKYGLAYYHTNAFVTGRYVRVVYVSYQGGSSLTKADAIEYLAWLDAGNVGTHWECERQAII